MSLKTKVNVVSFYNYQLSTVFNVSTNKNEEAEMMLSNNESKVTVAFSVQIMLNENTDDECIFFKSDELVYADIRKTILKKDKIYQFCTIYLLEI